MKNNVNFISTSAITMLFVFLAQGLFAQTPTEQAIRTTALNYIEGWYSADTARMAKALSPDLKKRGFRVSPKTNQLSIYEASYSQMIEWTGERQNELKQNPMLKIEVSIIEIGENIAMVKTISPRFIDYIHMGRMNGEWKIYNVIWEPNNNIQEEK